MEKQKQKLTRTFWVWAVVLFLSLNASINGSMNIVQAETMVYVTPTGSKYHAGKCGNGTYTLATLSYALSRGLSPCSKCFGSGYTPSPDPAPTPTPTPAPSNPPAKKPIKISKTSLLLVKGQSAKLKVKNATGNISWHSSKSSIAAVSKNGKVTAKKKGKATITVRNGTDLKTCKITVEEPKLNAKTVSLDLNQSKKLKLSGCSHSVKWTTSNSSIVKVSKGKVTAKRVGTARITAKVHGKKFTCKVTVKKPKVQKIILETTSVNMEYGKDAQLKLRTVPANAINYYNISVKSSNSSIVSASFDDFYNAVLLESRYKTGNAAVSVSIGGVTAKCNVNVAPAPVTSLELDTANLTLHSGESCYLSFTAEPYDSEYYYNAVWSTEDPSVAIVEKNDSGLGYAYIKALGEGQTDITLTLGNKTAFCHVTVQP